MKANKVKIYEKVVWIQESLCFHYRASKKLELPMMSYDSIKLTYLLSYIIDQGFNARLSFISLPKVV